MERTGRPSTTLRLHRNDFYVCNGHTGICGFLAQDAYALGMSTALRVPHRMTVAEFQDWLPPAGSEDRRWHLVDGEPVCMAPTSITHGLIQSEVGGLIWAHLRHMGSPCRIVTTPGVIPRVRSASNERIPDLGITCTPQTGGRVLTDPVVLIEIVSPSNEADTRRNVWAYTTIPSVAEILLLSSTSVAGELLRRDPQGEWASDPLVLGIDSMVELASIGFAASMRDIYATTSLTAE